MKITRGLLILADRPARQRSQPRIIRIPFALTLGWLLLLPTIPPAYADTPTFDEVRLLGTDTSITYSAVVGDVDGDGDLDVVVGNWHDNLVYLNDAGTFDTTSHTFGTGSDDTRSVALGDVDGDSDLDVIAGNYGEQDAVYLNDGDGTFDTTWYAFGTGADDTRSVALGDVDGDADLDIVAGNAHTNMVYLNDGDGTFDTTSYAFGTGSDDTRVVALGDVDADGNLDVVVGNYGEQNIIYLNDGDGTFDTTSYPFGLGVDQTYSAVLGDVDGDGDLDIVVGNNKEQNGVYLNDGDGTFDTTSRPFGLGTGETYSVALGDVDGDGDLDVVVGNEEQDGIYLNDGDGTFDVISYVFQGSDRTRSVALGDVDDDGDLDTVTGNWYRQNVVHINNGDGFFGATSYNFGGGDRTESVATGDVDGDTDLDVIVGNYGQQNVVYLNDGDGSFDTTSYPFGAGANSTRSVALGDVDGQNGLDIVVGNYGEQNVVYLNDGDGTFDTTSYPFGPGSDSTYSVALGDVNGDTYLDIVVGNEEQQNIVYLNDGDGSFDTTSYPFGSGTDGTYGMALGDVDGQNGLDIVVGNYGEQNAAYLNNGDGTFSAHILSEIDYTYDVALEDVDGQNGLDIVVGNCGQESKIYLNDGDGSFDTTWYSFDPGNFFCIHSVALDDVDGQNGPDIVVGRSDPQDAFYSWNQVYLNDGDGTFDTLYSLFGESWGRTHSVAVGDVDGDNAPDIIAGNEGQDAIYLNDGDGTFDTTSYDFGPHSGCTRSVALGDVDGDGNLDIVVGNEQDQNMVYLNDGDGTFGTTLHPFGTSSDDTWGVVLGDVDGDDDLDIVVGNYGEQNAIYLNDGDGTFDTTSHPFGTGADSTRSAALGDVDDDGDLDIVVGNTGQYMVCMNDGDGTFDTTVYNFGTGTVNSVTLGDVDSDGDLDVVAGRAGQDVVYLNDGDDNPFDSASYTFGTGSDQTWSVALGDVDGDGNLDVVAGDFLGQNMVYLNDGNGNPFDTASNAFGTYTDNTCGVALGDVDGDGDLDIVVGNGCYIKTLEQNAVYLNDGDGQFGWSAPTRPFGLSTASTGRTESVALGDVNSDGILDVIAGNNYDQPNAVYLNRIRVPGRMTNNPPIIMVTRPGPTANADFYSTPRILDEPTIPVPYTLFDPESDPVRSIRAVYSLNGGGHWQTATLTHTATADLIASPVGVTHVLTWNTLDSGFFGQSANVVLRIEAYPALRPTSNTVPGPYQWPYAAATTFPFRVRGTQVRVISGTLPGANALVYRLPGGQGRAYQPYRDHSGRLLDTDAHGYLRGHGELRPDDWLVALLPITATDTYTLYYTNAVPTLTSLDAYTVTALGVQTLTVRADNPLMLFNLDISLEWDARQDTLFLEQLEFDLQRASEFLYDWTNGQAALGRLTLYHDHEHWSDAHVRIYASNRLRPNATLGGIVSTVVTDPLKSDITYAPGQLRMAAVWNRYGESSGNLGEDWPRTLAHELGHYALFLDDAYLGLDDDGLLIPVDTCTGTAMADPYRDDYGEFHLDAGWLPDCEDTLAQRTVGRSDWATIHALYPWLTATTALSGPTGLPLAVTQIQVVEPVTPVTTLDVPIFYLSQDGARVQPGLKARAVLFQPNRDRMIDLGRATLDQVVARGARPGDRVCLYELEKARLGCEDVTSGDDQLALVSHPDWQPDVIVTPITSRTVNISVTVDGVSDPLRARLYPLSGSASEEITLTAVATGHYSGTFDNLNRPALAAYVHIWVDEPEPRREIVTDYALGGNPVTVTSRDVTVTSRDAPGVSSDGHAMIFGATLVFTPGTFISLQAATILPAPPSWATVVGQGYRLLVSPGAPSLNDASLRFQYSGRDVPPGEEHLLKLYFWDGIEWRQLPTKLDAYSNTAVAPAQGKGLYVLMSSIEIPLYGPGWNNFAYPVQGKRPVTEALRSIDGYYSIVYGHVTTDTVDPWRVYGVGAPSYVNRLHELQFGRGYWISVTEAITLLLKGASEMTPDSASSLYSPPSTYYGQLRASAGFTPTAGMSVTAWIDDNLCGQNQALEVNGQVVYVVHVLADGPGPGGTTGCGETGRLVRFRVDGQLMASTAAWDDSQLWRLPLSIGPLQHVYLPLVVRGWAGP